jgi:ketosteroid isomerase-like protein
VNAGPTPVTAFYDAINRQDRAAAEETLAPDIRWHRPPDVPVTGTVEGAEGVARMWRAFAGSLERFEIRPTRFEGSGNLVLAPITMRGTGPNGDFEFGGAQVFRIADGLIAEVWEFRSLPEARRLLEG